jgi:hypothetical protein
VEFRIEPSFGMHGNEDSTYRLRIGITKYGLATALPLPPFSTHTVGDQPRLGRRLKGIRKR